jgi:glycosyltransferase involved in cell wall biosynthesis
MELGGMSKYHPFIVIMQAAENFAYKHCDAVVSMLPKTEEYMRSHGLKGNKWSYVPNGICLDEINKDEPLPAQHETVLTQLKKQGKIIVGYAGTLGIANAVEYLVKTASLIQNNSVHFVITGIGPEEENLKNLATGLTNITFLPPVKKTQVQNLLKLHDILYIGLKNEPLFRFGISPNKMFDYMYAAKPIIMAIKAGNDPVGEAKCGITIEPENPQAIIEAINTLISKPENERIKMGENGRNFVLQNHTYEKLSSKFLEIMNSL